MLGANPPKGWNRKVPTDSTRKKKHMEVQTSIAWAVSGKQVFKDLFKTFWGSSADTCSILLLATAARGHSGNQDLDEDWSIIVLGKG